MQNLDRRVTALEAAGPRSALRVIRAQLGETAEQACERFGVSPETNDVWVIVRTIVDPKPQLEPHL